MDDIAELTARNDYFIEACRQGSWETLRKILAPEFRYLDGLTGAEWDEERYVADLVAGASPTLSIDQVVIRVVADTATVSARTRTRDRPGGQNRYLDTYARSEEGWLCVHACVWPLPDALG